METRWEKLAIPNFSMSTAKPDDIQRGKGLTCMRTCLADQEADQQPAQEVDPEEAPTFSVSISIKNLLKFLATNLANTTTIACMSSRLISGTARY